jgi:hypothetical protein
MTARQRDGERERMGMNGTERTRQLGEPDTRKEWDAVTGNERLTALAGLALLVLFAIEIATTAALRELLSVHILVGVALVFPLAIKLVSVGYRFICYYSGLPAFERRGPPQMALRILAPALLAMTALLVGTGLALLVVTPDRAGLLRSVHGLSALLWLPLFVLHTAAYAWRAQRLASDDWQTPPVVAQAPGRGLRLGANLLALAGGAIAAVVAFPTTAPWVAWVQTTGEAPGPRILLIGAVLTLFALGIATLIRYARSA